MIDEAMRKAFEAFYVADSRPFIIHFGRCRVHPSDYHCPHITAAWHAWQESARSQSARAERAEADLSTLGADAVLYCRLRQFADDFEVAEQAADAIAFLRAALAAKERECEALRKDAERYRWLRVQKHTPDEIDDAIDAAIAQRAEPTDRPTPQPQERESTDRESR